MALSLLSPQMARILFEDKMDINIQDKFLEYCKFLQTMSLEARLTICELIFCDRENILTTVLVFNDKQTFLSILEKYPEEFNTLESRRYYIDIDSLGTNKVRAYNSENDDLILTGYYLNDGIVYETKKYKRSDSRLTLNIDRYDSNGILISPNEKEIECDIAEWTGPQELIDIAQSNDMFINVMKKIDKNQTYLRLRSRPALNT